jgi:APA family basic amino acid/polyamine antiporter
MEKRYGLVTAIAMVAGIVIGSGVFFKGGAVLNATGGNLWLGILAWVVTGLSVLLCAFAFCVYAAKYEGENGLSGFAKRIVHSKYGYAVGWFMATIYTPCMVAVVAWVCGNYTTLLFGITNDAFTWAFAAFYLIATYGMNMLTPKLAGRFQVSALFLKLIPLILMAIVGTITGLINGTTIANFQDKVSGDIGSGLFAAILPTLFCYDGWMMVTTISPELKNSKKNLPLALLIGMIIIISVYLLYFIGINSSLPIGQLNDPDNATNVVKDGFAKVFSNFAGTALFVFVIISCLGTLNGMTLAQTRAFKQIADSKHGIGQKFFGEVGDKTKTPHNSGVIGLLISVVWFIVWFINLNFIPGGVFDISELPIVFCYLLYIPIHIMAIKKHKEMKILKRWILPIIATLVSGFIMFCAIWQHGINTLWFGIVFVAIMGIGLLFLIDWKKETPKKILKYSGLYYIAKALTFEFKKKENTSLNADATTSIETNTLEVKTEKENEIINKDEKIKIDINK